MKLFDFNAIRLESGRPHHPAGARRRHGKVRIRLHRRQPLRGQRQRARAVCCLACDDDTGLSQVQIQFPVETVQFRDNALNR